MSYKCPFLAYPVGKCLKKNPHISNYTFPESVSLLIGTGLDSIFQVLCILAFETSGMEGILFIIA